MPETNALAFDKQVCSTGTSIPNAKLFTLFPQTHTLYSGCGDSNIYAWDLETGQLKVAAGSSGWGVTGVCVLLYRRRTRATRITSTACVFTGVD